MSFIFGYGGTRLEMAQYEQQRTVRQLNFEFWRRTRAMMEYGQSVGVDIGVGTGWRIQPTNGGPGFASPGNSNHEGFPADGVSGGAVAADMVPASSWPWMQGQVARFGLKTFANVNNEPWHIQPVEIPNSRNWRRHPWVLQPWALPNQAKSLSDFGINPVANQWGLYPFQSWRDKPGVLVGMGEANLLVPNTGYIFYAQAVIHWKMGQPAMKIDGFWGAASGLYLAAQIQGWNRFTGDSIPVQTGIGLDQWRLIDAYAKDFTNLVP
jgi:hypothetical protein